MTSTPTSRLAIRAALLAVVTSLSLGLGAREAPAQVCFGPDGLDVAGGCCVAVTPNLPQLPNVVMGGLGICWTNCAVSTTRDLVVDWAPPTQVGCTEYTTTLRVLDTGSAMPVLMGNMVLDYTRTWDETDPAGITRQVWRYVVKADLSPVPGGVTTCPFPACLFPVGTHQTAFYYGYIDYTCSTPGLFESALVLYHACDKFIHRPGFSDKPGTFHPTESYAIVAPHSAAQPFVPANMTAPSGPLIGEAIRDVGPSGPPPVVCLSEDPVVTGSLVGAAQGCVCTLSVVPPHQTLRTFNGQTACVGGGGAAGGWASLAINFPINPWFHLVSNSIGRWTNNNFYPGAERVWADEGVFVHQSTCSGDFAELKYGATTRGGWSATLPSGVPATSFTDLADNYTAPIAGPFPTPILGSIQPTDHLIYVNTP